MEDYEVIVNRLNYDMTKKGDMLDVTDIVEILSVKLIGVVPDDRNITISTNKGEPIVLDDKALAGKAFNNIARRILGEEVPFLDLKEMSESGFMGVFKKLFKK